MIKAYTAANLQDAHILLGALRAQGIAARILNAAAQGGLGEIPWAQACPEIWVQDASDLDRARATFAAFERPATNLGEVRCAGCGQSCPESFAVCWSCGEPVEPD